MSAGASPQTPLGVGSLQRSPDLSVFREPTSKGRGGENAGRRREGKEGERRGGVFALEKEKSAGRNQVHLVYPVSDKNCVEFAIISSILMNYALDDDVRLSLV